MQFCCVVGKNRAERSLEVHHHLRCPEQVKLQAVLTPSVAQPTYRLTKRRPLTVLDQMRICFLHLKDTAPLPMTTVVSDSFNLFMTIILGSQ